jgi:phosphotransferase system  glucose/maltose/N-acetylglucosamine-specific IIC component
MHTTLTLLNDLAAAPVPLAAKTLPEVISGIQGWIMGILAAIATMFFVIGGLRYMTAGGDPAQVEQAKGNFKSAAIGYALAVLAPVLLTILAGIVGGPTQ